MVQDFGDSQKKIDVYCFPTEDIIHIGSVAMQLLGKLGNADVFLIEYFLDSFSDMNLLKTRHRYVLFKVQKLFS